MRPDVTPSSYRYGVRDGASLMTEDTVHGGYLSPSKFNERGSNWESTEYVREIHIMKIIGKANNVEPPFSTRLEPNIF